MSRWERGWQWMEEVLDPLVAPVGKGEILHQGWPGFKGRFLCQLLCIGLGMDS